MLFTALPLALVAAQFCSAIPIAPSEVVLALKADQSNLDILISDVTNSSLANAQVAYANFQADLDDIGFSLGQITDANCIALGPDSNAPSATSQSAVLAALSSIEPSLSSISSSVSSSNNASAVAAYEAAQSALDSTYDFIFGVETSSGSSPAHPSPLPNTEPVFGYIQSAQQALEELEANVVDSDNASAKQSYSTVSSILSGQIAPVASCSFSATGSASCSSAITCVQELQLTLNEISEDLLAGESTSADCSTAGAYLSAINSLIS